MEAVRKSHIRNRPFSMQTQPWFQTKYQVKGNSTFCLMPQSLSIPLVLTKIPWFNVMLCGLGLTFIHCYKNDLLPRVDK